MTRADPPNGQDLATNTVWRGLDFSGFTLVLGVGTGRLIRLLNEQVAASQGILAVVSYEPAQLRSLVPLMRHGPITPIHGRPRQLPVLREVVDLLVVNAVLRQVPDPKLEAMCEELWCALVPGGQLRISDVIEPSEAQYNAAWAERNRIVRKFGRILGRPVALSVDLKGAARALRSVGFENLSVSILPGHGLTDDWLEETVNVMRSMAGSVADRSLRSEILDQDLARLIRAYAQGGQRGAERFILRGTKPGHLALDMEASFTEEDLVGPAD